MSVNPRVETLPAWISAGIRQVVPMSELGDTFPKAYEAVAGVLARAGVPILGPAYACYFGMPDENVDVEIGFGVDRVIDLPGLMVSERPETRAALGTYVGPYSGLQDAYGELTAWLDQQKFTLANDMFEFYDSEPDEDPAKTVTRMVFPIVD